MTQLPESDFRNYVFPVSGMVRDGIDIFAVSDADRYVLCIENKVGSGEHDNQLNRYRQIIAETYPGFRARFIYLTPDCVEASDPEHWIPMGYADMPEIIESVTPDGRAILVKAYYEPCCTDRILIQDCPLLPSTIFIAPVAEKVHI